MRPRANLNYKNSNRQINSKASFVQETQSLIQQFDNRIGNMSSYAKHEQTIPTENKVFIDEMNELKRQRFELVELLRRHQNLDEQEWRQIKHDVINVIQHAENTLLTTGQLPEENR